MDNERIYTFEVLNGPIYPYDEAPDFWVNETPFNLDRKFADLNADTLESFPLIDDFVVRLENYKVDGNSPFGYRVVFFSLSRGYTTDFPWWDRAERDLRRGDFQFPIGDFDRPHSNMDESWEILIAAKDDFVYILQGSSDEEDYYVWYKVTKERYIAEWHKAIALCRYALAPKLLSSGL